MDFWHQVYVGESPRLKLRPNGMHVIYTKKKVRARFCLRCACARVWLKGVAEAFRRRTATSSDDQEASGRHVAPQEEAEAEGSPRLMPRATEQLRVASSIMPSDVNEQSGAAASSVHQRRTKSRSTEQPRGMRLLVWCRWATRRRTATEQPRAALSSIHQIRI